MPLNIVYTAQASHTARCTAGTGTPAVGEAVSESIISQRDADRKAVLLAQARAENALQCALPPAPAEPVFYNEEQVVSGSCDVGKADLRPPFDPTRVFTVVVAAGAIYSTISVADANNAAAAKAQYELVQQLLGYCRVFYQNTEQSFTYTCPMPQEGGSTATVPADTYVSFVSQAAVDAQALEAARAEAIAATTCVQRYYNTQQTATVECVAPQVGPPGVGIVAANTYLDYTLEDANAAAYADALAIATAAAAENCSGELYANAARSYTAYCDVVFGPGYDGAPSTATVPANTYFSDVSQEDANNLALAAAQALAESYLMCFLA